MSVSGLSNTFSDSLIHGNRENLKILVLALCKYPLIFWPWLRANIICHRKEKPLDVYEHVPLFRELEAARSNLSSSYRKAFIPDLSQALIDHLF